RVDSLRARVVDRSTDLADDSVDGTLVHRRMPHQMCREIELRMHDQNDRFRAFKTARVEQRHSNVRGRLVRAGRPHLIGEGITGNGGVSAPLKGGWPAFIAPRRGRSRHASSPIMIGTAVRGGTERRLLRAAARGLSCWWHGALALGGTAGASLPTKVSIV